MTFFQKVERLFLYIITLLVAAAVAYLAWVLGNMKTEPPDGISERLGELAEMQRAHDQKAAALEAKIGDLRKGVDARFDDVDGALDGIDTKLGTIGDRLKGLDQLEQRVAEAVCRRLQPEYCTGQPPPKPPTLRPNFTLFYENARLDAAGEVSEESFGIRLTEDHEARLGAIVRAFKPCQRGSQAVELSIFGASSTAEFRAHADAGAEVLPETNALNVETARLRAEIVAEYLRNGGLAATVEVPTDTVAYSALVRPYVDELPGETTDQEALNRTVFIRVEQAGACEVQ